MSYTFTELYTDKEKSSPAERRCIRLGLQGSGAVSQQNDRTVRFPTTGYWGKIFRDKTDVYSLQKLVKRAW